MTPVTFKCPNCSGPLLFNPGKQLFSCEYCLSEFDEATLIALAEKEQKKAEEEQKKAEGEQDAKAQEQGGAQGEDGASPKAEEEQAHTAVYSCPSCGAEVVTDETTAATYCYFCHNPVVLSGRLTSEFKPDLVLPFTFTKDEAIKKFMEWTGKKKFVPRDFFQSKHIDNLMGVYYPYWATDFKVDASYSGEGQIITHSSTATEDITTTQYYDVQRAGDIEFNNVMRSALKKEDRKLGDGIHPYDLNGLKPFSMAYLSGFMAEKRDITKDEVRPEIVSELQEYIEPLLTADAHYSLLNGSATQRVEGESFRYVLLPSWILTYRDHAGKLWHYAMNGQNGTLCGKLPIDKGKLFGLCGGIAAAVLAISLLGGWLIG